MVVKAIRVWPQKRRLQRRREAVVEHQGMLWRLAMSWSHDRNLADDLAQETLVRALEKVEDLRDEAQLRSWLCAILHNCWCNYWRQNRHTATMDPVESDERLRVDDDCPREAEHECIRRAIAALPRGQREVVTLVELEGFSYKEVSNAVGIPIGTVMSRLCRARRALAERLAQTPGCEDAEGNVRGLRAVK